MTPIPTPTTPLDLITGIETRRQPALYAKRDIAIVRGEGAYLYDSDGKRYLDAMSNYGIASLGHADPEFTAAMVKQLETLTTCHQSFYNDARALALAAIAELVPDSLARVFLSNSGAEAIEAALKFALTATGRRKFVAAKKGYHGRTLGALSVTADAKYRGPFEPLSLPVAHVTYNDVASLEAAVDGETAAIILEPILGEGGIVPADVEFLQAARRLADQHGALLIADEIQTGFRTGAPFAMIAAGVVPDILVAAKAIANGIPVGATIITDAVAEAIPPGAHGTTFGANPLACGAIVTTLRAFKERELYERSARLGPRVVEGIQALGSPKVRDVRGRGLMIGVELKERVTPTIRALQECGVLVLPATPVVFRLLPPLIWTETQVDELLTALGEVLNG